MPTNNKTLKVCILRTTEVEWGINTIGWKKQKDFFQKMMAKGNSYCLRSPRIRRVRLLSDL